MDLFFFVMQYDCQLLFTDSAYQDPIFHGALAKILPYPETEIVKRSGLAFIRAETAEYVTIVGNSILAPAGVANLVAKPINVGKANSGASQIGAPASFPV